MEARSEASAVIILSLSFDSIQSALSQGVTAAEDATMFLSGYVVSMIISKSTLCARVNPILNSLTVDSLSFLRARTCEHGLCACAIADCLRPSFGLFSCENEIRYLPVYLSS